MTIQINYKNNGPKKITSNLVLFVDEKFNLNGVKKYISNTEYSYISDLLKNSDLKKQLLFFEINSISGGFIPSNLFKSFIGKLVEFSFSNRNI